MRKKRSTGWSEDRKLVLHELVRMNKSFEAHCGQDLEYHEKMMSELGQIKERLAFLNGKIAGVGAVAAAIVSIAIKIFSA